MYCGAMADPVTFKLRAAPLPAERLPRVFETPLRSAAATDDDPFLPPGLLRVDAAFDLSGAARATEAGRVEHVLKPVAGQVLVLELPEGVTVITHADNLHDTLRRIDPQAIDEDGAIVFERALQQRSAAMRGTVGDAVGVGLNAIVSQVYTLSVGQVADPIIDAAKRKAAERLGVPDDRIDQVAELGVSWLGTKALMWAIESRLQREPGLYRWGAGTLVARLDA